MPCNMYDGATSGDFAAGDAREALRRIAELEQALCGLCQQLERQGLSVAHLQMGVRNNLHPQLAMWYEKHRRLPGCSLNASGEQK